MCKKSDTSYGYKYDGCIVHKKKNEFAYKQLDSGDVLGIGIDRTNAEIFFTFNKTLVRYLKSIYFLKYLIS